MSNSFVIGGIFDDMQSPKFCVSGLKSHRDSASGCTELRAFLRLLSERNDTSKWACMGCTQETQANDHPVYSLAAFLSGTAKVYWYMVRQADKRLNDFLQGLWAIAGSGVIAWLITLG